MGITRFIIVSGLILISLIIHELYSESIFASFPFLATEIGWWLIGGFLITYILIFEKKSVSSIGIGRISKSTFSTAAIGFVLALIGVVVFGLITQLTGLDPTSTEERLNETTTWPLKWLVFIFLRAGVVEELFFRGFVISRLLDLNTPRWIALLISTLLFVLPHALFWPSLSLIMVGFSGLAFGIIFIWKRDLWACILAHVGFNVAGVIAASLS